MKHRRITHFKLAGAISFILISIYVVFTQDFSSAQRMTHEEKPGGFQDFFKNITVPIGEEVSGYQAGYRISELEGLKKKKSVLKSTFSDTLVWQSRGPYNVGGRSRTILVDPDDPNGETWYAGTAGGGIWKTEDAGESWSDLTPELPNLSTVTLCMAESNHDLIFAGTGEGFGGIGMITGDGLFKSSDRGETWNRVESTRNEDFFYINDIWVSPTDEDMLMLATNRGIYKTLDGGDSWDTVYRSGYRVQDLVQNPEKPSTIYAAVNTIGTIKSYDNGSTWTVINEGFKDIARLALAVSPVDTSYVFASAEKKNGTMAVYISTNSGESWLPNKEDSNFINFHNAQGWYNNAIAADPFVKEKVYVAGVYIGALTFGASFGESDPTILNVDTLSTSTFLDFINFGGSQLGGGMSTGIEEAASVTQEDFVSVELRFGDGLTQKAHRFQVPEGEGPGVPSTDYAYQDYVDVPFQAWDMTNNKQVMISFRDQERDGAFNLIARDPDDEIPGREYIFIHAIEYDASNPDASVALAGGHYEKMMYFFWPTLAIDGVWEPESLPISTLSIEYGSYAVQEASTEIIASNTKNTNLHVDHHELVIIPGASAGADHVIISANDGGVAISKNTGSTWKQLSNGLYTTQFYGVAKKTGEDVFIGGMQDNGTWKSPDNKIATEMSDYSFVLGGDGFEVLWHPKSKSSIIGSIYNNQFYVTRKPGVWNPASEGLGTTGPFISKLSHSRSRPDTIYTIDAEGVYMNTRFGSANWKRTSIAEGLDYYGRSTSSIDVEVSKADPSIIWAGQGMFETPVLNIFVSEDYAASFTPTSLYPDVEMGFISAIETHPTEPNTAYLLYSYQGKPKILRTVDLGTTWEDISGFGTESISSNGFPDVVVLSLLVMPHDPDVIWAGTELGIVESVDNGVTWHLLDSDFPNVTIYQMDFQDNQILLGTHGRGIWTAGVEVVVSTTEEEDLPEELKLFNATVYPNPVQSELYISLSGAEPGPLNLKLYAANGSLMLEESHTITAHEQVFELSLENQKPGSYFLQVRAGNHITSKRVVVY
jgi:photosystem II stability/assembly factor-like uncharacterized protein